MTQSPSPSSLNSLFLIFFIILFRILSLLFHIFSPLYIPLFRPELFYLIPLLYHLIYWFFDISLPTSYSLIFSLIVQEMFTTPVREENLGYSASIYIPPGPRLGDIIIEAKGVCKAYGDKLLMKNVDFSIPQGVCTIRCVFVGLYVYMWVTMIWYVTIISCITIQRDSVHHNSLISLELSSSL